MDFGMRTTIHRFALTDARFWPMFAEQLLRLIGGKEEPFDLYTTEFSLHFEMVDGKLTVTRQEMD